MGNRCTKCFAIAAIASSVIAVNPILGQSVALGVPSGEFSTSNLVTLNVRSAELKSVLGIISKQAGLELYFPEESSLRSKLVTMNVRGVRAVDAFAQALVGTRLRASIVKGMVMLVDDGSLGASVVQGGIAGTVVDAKTKQPLGRVTLMLDGTTKGATSGNDGRFRFDNVAPGTHTIKVRAMGYVKATKSIDVQDGQAASITIALEQSTNELDQVVVTGSIIPTERRAIANSMTVITAKDLEDKGITRLDQLFRGDVPGLFAPDLGNDNALDSVRLFSRGATNIGSLSNGNFNANAITSAVKTYLDGIELASPELISQIDPNSIDRIEILTGPQAATTYGSNATNGVIQIFTKRGTTTAPRWRFNANTGFIQNQSRIALAPSNDLSASVSGMEGRVSYSGGGALNTTGPWVPNKNTTRYNGNLGAKIDYTALALDFTVRQSMTTNLSKGSSSVRVIDACEQGLLNITGTQASFCRQGASNALPKNVLNRSQALSQSLGLSIAIKPIFGWGQTLTLGRDGTATRSSKGLRGYLTPNDTLLTASYSNNGTTSLNYRINGSLGFGSVLRATVVSGVNASQSNSSGVSGSGSTVAEALSIKTFSSGNASQNRNLNGFFQVSTGFFDNLYLTYGLNSEWNKKYGYARNPNLQPKYGATLVREVGPITAKLRMSYGAATTPPNIGQKEGVWFTDPNYIAVFGPFQSPKANPDLGPSYQVGTDGGVDLLFGSRFSVNVTKFDQKVSDLIMYLYADSLPIKEVMVIGQCNPVNGWDAVLTALGCYEKYFHQIMYVNAGGVRNRGYETRVRFSLAALTFDGTYSWTKSRSLGWGGARGTTGTVGYAPGASFPGFAEHTWNFGVAYANRSSSISIRLNGVGQVNANAKVPGLNGVTVNSGGMNAAYVPRIPVYDMPLYLTGGYTGLCDGTCIPKVINPGYLRGDLNARRKVSSRVSANLNTTNLFNSYRFDGDAYVNSAKGRTVRTGFSLDL